MLASASAQQPHPRSPARVSTSEALCVWSGPALLVLLGAGFLLAGLVPPPSPAAPAQEIRAFYAEDPDLRRAGIVLLSVGGSLFLPFGVAVAAQLRRIEGPNSAAAAVQLGAATITAATTIVYTFVMLALAFRPARDAGIMLALNDLAWIPFVGVWTPGALQACAVATAVLGDRRPPGERLLPRWLGWLSLWMAFTSLTGSLVPFFTDGPFAWNGLIGFYVAATVFLGWYVAMFTVLRRGLVT
ncbi:MAG TPA: hypothetical protein VD931_17470 [Baekduia sp.]|nr:hypothetical protein [Baekduia sp.]